MKGIILVHANKCLGCKTCELACAVEHSVSQELFEAIEESPAPASRVNVSQGKSLAVPLQCRQCENAPCAAVCPTKALHRDEAGGPVLLTRDLCIGCKWCILACPFGVIRFDTNAGLIIKCDQCIQRLEKGQLPACVTACPTKALEFEKIEEVIRKKRDDYLVQIECGVTEK